jgi:hypothetical protein
MRNGSLPSPRTLGTRGGGPTTPLNISSRHLVWGIDVGTHPPGAICAIRQGLNQCEFLIPPMMLLDR